MTASTSAIAFPEGNLRACARKTNRGSAKRGRAERRSAAGVQAWDCVGRGGVAGPRGGDAGLRSVAARGALAWRWRVAARALPIPTIWTWAGTCSPARASRDVPKRRDGTFSFQVVSKITSTIDLSYSCYRHNLESVCSPVR